MASNYDAAVAVVHRAELRPTKLELLAGWLPGRRWCHGVAAGIERVAAYRFDDPAGAVGIETLLVRAGDGPVHQVPLTYRDAPLAGGDGWLVGTAEHAVLGRRWVYDACGDPLYAATLASAILGGTGQADEFVQVDGRLERREPTMTVTGSGTRGAGEAGSAGVPPVGALPRVLADDDPTLVVTDTVRLAVVRRLDHGATPTGATPTGATLTGTWPGQPTPLLLAYASPR